MDAQQTIKQTADAVQPLWDWLLRVPFSFDAQIFYALCIGSALGMIAHYLKQAAAKDVEGNLFDYLFHQHLNRTLLAAFGIVSWSIGEDATGLFYAPDGSFVGWALVIVSGFKTGYAGDSIANKASRPVWTDEKRAAATQEKQS